MRPVKGRSRLACICNIAFRLVSVSDKPAAISTISWSPPRPGLPRPSRSRRPPSSAIQDLPKRPPDDPKEHRDRKAQWEPQGPVPNLPAGILAEERSPKVGEGTPLLSAEQSTDPHRGRSNFGWQHPGTTKFPDTAAFQGNYDPPAKARFFGQKRSGPSRPRQGSSLPTSRLRRRQPPS